MRPLTSRSAHLIFVICFVNSLAWGQKFALGLKAAGSYNNSYVFGQSQYNSAVVYGGSLGIFGTFQIKDKIKVRAEALVTSRGFKTQFNSTGSSTSLASVYSPSLAPSSSLSTGPGGAFFATLTQNTFYLDVPLGVDYEILRGLNLQAGGMISLFLNQWNSSLENSSTVKAETPSDTNYYQQYQFSVYGGAYYQFPFGLAAGARANFGLTNTYVQVTTGTGHQVYPYSYQVFVTYPLIKF